MYLPRSRWSGTAWLIRASVVGSSAAAPRPETACPAHTHCTESEDSDIAAPSAQSAMPVWKTRLRPWTSPHTPVVRISAAIGSTKASETQDSWDVEAPRARWMAGRLTDTVVTGR